MTVEGQNGYSQGLIGWSAAFKADIPGMVFAGMSLSHSGKVLLAVMEGTLKNTMVALQWARIVVKTAPKHSIVAGC